MEAINRFDTKRCKTYFRKKHNLMSDKEDQIQEEFFQKVIGKKERDKKL